MLITPDAAAELTTLAAELAHHTRCNCTCPDSVRIRAEIDAALDLVLETGQPADKTTTHRVSAAGRQ